MRLTRTRSAFTLVELLVVIGIIAVLIGILLPALSAARRQANATRCASQLREIGNAIHLYVNEFKGYLPVVRHETAASGTWPPTTDSKGNKSYKFGPSGIHEYWYTQLLRYFVKTELARLPDGRVSLKNYERTPLWGCPGALKDDIEALSTNDANFNSGYGMGPYLLYRPNTYKGVNGIPPAPPAPTPGLNAWHWPMIEDGSGGKKGRYMKIEEVEKPAEKGIISDARAWFLEIRDPTGQGDPPPQRIGYLIYDQFQIDQFDRYRHGKYPNVVNGVYDRVGGKQLFNVLFVDGHVAALSDVRDGFRAFRGKYPG